MKKKVLMAVFFGMMLALPAMSFAQDCDGNPCSDGNYVWIQMQGNSWADAGPNGESAAFAAGQYDVNIDVEDPDGVDFVGTLSGGYFGESFSDDGEASWAQGFSESWAQWGREQW